MSSAQQKAKGCNSIHRQCSRDSGIISRLLFFLPMSYFFDHSNSDLFSKFNICANILGREPTSIKVCLDVRQNLGCLPMSQEKDLKWIKCLFVGVTGVNAMPSASKGIWTREDVKVASNLSWMYSLSSQCPTSLKHYLLFNRSFKPFLLFKESSLYVVDTEGITKIDFSLEISLCSSFRCCILKHRFS